MPTFRYEISLGRKSGAVICGVDEAGRGPLAGPVFACAAILPLEGLSTRLLGVLDDSKRLTPEVREAVAIKLRVKAIYALGEASVEEIDRFNILRATFMAMRRAFEQLPVQPVHAIIDGNMKPGLPCEETTVVEGDHLSYSVAAASILAKVARDKMMRELAPTYPRYGWETNVGYATPEHRAAIEAYGLTPHHRVSFKPVYEQLSLID
ncbi:MAG TPA: ribonuclease HII [Dongiaceae bacterium]|jgi:ribonuclease HII|nr:ribonuclease HII [Dongiaceae bacterium]